MATKRISANQLKDLAIQYKSQHNKNEDDSVFAFMWWVERELTKTD